MSEKSGCETVQITFHGFLDEAVIFAQPTVVLAGALDLLSEEAQPLELRSFLDQDQFQAFGDILDATVESIPVNGVDGMWNSRRRLPTLAA